MDICQGQALFVNVCSTRKWSFFLAVNYMDVAATCHMSHVVDISVVDMQNTFLALSVTSSVLVSKEQQFFLFKEPVLSSQTNQRWVS
jgi:hypothetical protein